MEALTLLEMEGLALTLELTDADTEALTDEETDALLDELID
jgi:hypothetical protein